MRDARPSPSDRRRVGGIIGLCVLAAAGLTGCGQSAAADGPGDAITRQYTPRAGQYEHIALPTHAPPEGALLESISYSDRQPHGEQMLISYNEVTVNACAYPAHDAVRKAACAPQPTERRLREVTVDGWTTRYTVGNKSGKFDGKAGEVGDFFGSAPMSANPGWITEYAAKEVKRRFG